MGEEKKGKVIVEGTLYEFSNDTIHTVTEGFVFEEKGWFSKKLSEHLHDSEYYDYEQYANELMAKYYDYYQQIKEIDYEYVLRGAVLTCTHGNKETRLDALEDHGVYFRNQPVMTCKDCKLEENIFSFGACGNSKYQPVYSDMAPQPADKELDSDGKERSKCIPILLREWGYGDNDDRYTLIIRNDSASNVYASDTEDERKKCSSFKSQIKELNKEKDEEEIEELIDGYDQALMTCDNLLCLYGGVITIVENPETEEEIVEEPEKENEEIESEQFQFTLEQLTASGWEGATEDDLIKLNEAMVTFKVTTRESAYMMLATMLCESANCTKKLEGAETFTDEEWEAYKKDLRERGIRVGDYEWWERGAGYIQLTGQKVQREFLKAIGDNYSGFNTAEHIGNNYPIEASVYFWGVVEKTGEKNLNAYVAKHGASEGIFLITQYFTNSFVNGIDPALVSIRNGGSYTIEKNQLIVNGQSFVLPNGWEDRAEVWEKVYDQMQKSK
ncbi:MAG: DUF4280 domain-containing protein [Lachnospiraceae bacterium]|nr:DUF4280 domain-containing protein [Lachnospiraceae bacterium]